MEFPQSALWDFSLRFYGTEGVSDACLRLQDRHGIDVNFVFFCVWAGVHGTSLQAGEIAETHAAIAEWHETVVRHLRHLRRRLKGGLAPVDDDLVQGLRARIQKIEIDAEHVEQLTLAARLDDAGAGIVDTERAAATAAANLDEYCALTGIVPAAADRHDLAFLVERGVAAAGTG